MVIEDRRNVSSRYPHPLHPSRDSGEHSVSPSIGEALPNRASDSDPNHFSANGEKRDMEKTNPHGQVGQAITIPGWYTVRFFLEASRR